MANNVNTLSPLDELQVGSFAKIKALITSSIYENPDNCYRVYEAKEKENAVPFKVNGNIPQRLVVGGKYELKGKVTEYKNSKQLTISAASLLETTEEDDIIRYLDGLSPVFSGFSDVLVGKYKKKTLYILKESINKVISDFPDIDKKIIYSWQQKVVEAEEYNNAFKMLSEFGLKPKAIYSLIKKYGYQVGYKVKSNPYFLLGRVPDISFKECDELAIKNNLNILDPNRIEQGVLQYLRVMAEKGDAFIEEEELIRESINHLSIEVPYSEALALYEKKTEEYTLGINILSFKYNDLFNYIEKAKALSEKNRKKAFFRVFQIQKDIILSALARLKDSKDIIQDGQKYYLHSIYDAEVKVAKKLSDIILNEKAKSYPAKDLIISYEKVNNIHLEDKQREAVENVIKSEGGFFVVNGGPGCGKTFTVKIMLDLISQVYKAEHRPYYEHILAPTGRAAEVLSKATGKDASTIHRKLEIDEEGIPKYSSLNPLLSSVIVVDETSMLNLDLALKLLDAVDPTSKVIFIGDSNQLPPIGTGKILKDILASTLKNRVFTLDVVKRQAKESSIIENATKIISGEYITTDRSKLDTVVLKAENDLRNIEKITGLATKALSAGKKITDIQVLCPTKIGTVGTNTLNYYLQQSLNPMDENKREELLCNVRIWDAEKKIPVNKQVFLRTGDKVIHTENNYKAQWYQKKDGKFIPDPTRLGIYNGEIGIVSDIMENVELGKRYKSIAVKYSEGYVIYSRTFTELELAYALTVHKSQGSQWFEVIIPVSPMNAKYLYREMLYTAFTRTQVMAVILGNKEDIEDVISRINPERRNSGLVERINALVK